jgi:hypothetical protein
MSPVVAFIFIVEGLYCRRPIQCLASSKILTPPPLHRPGGYTRWVERGWGVNILEDARQADTALYSTYVSTL